MDARDSTLPTQPKAARKKAKGKVRPVARAKPVKNWSLDKAIEGMNKAFRDTFKDLAR